MARVDDGGRVRSVRLPRVVVGRVTPSTYTVEFRCPICGFEAVNDRYVKEHWQMHQKDPKELRDLLAKLSETRKGGGS